MKNNMRSVAGAVIHMTAAFKIMVPAFFALVWVSCKDTAKASVPEEQHDAVLKKPDGSAIYIDAVPNSAVMQNNAGDTGTTRFHSFRIGFSDSVITDRKQEMLKQRYYDFEMEHDWTALVNGDSVRPVFFHPQVQKTNVLKEFIVVFETEAASGPDTFIYKDRSRREINTIVLKRK